MKRGALIFSLILMSCGLIAQTYTVENHPNNRRKAIIKNDSIRISEYVFSEISEFSEGKAYVAQGELYAYIDTAANELTEYEYVEANNFMNGYAVVGDSTGKSIINSKFERLMPYRFQQVLLPKNGLIRVQSEDGLWGAYDTTGVLKILPEYDIPPRIINRDRIIVRKLDEYGVINDCNEVIFNCAYQYITNSGYGFKSGKYLKLFNEED
jgi:hypothetical protein